ncbi:MAG TPA: hypothetical protein VF731_01590 [Solirubrobacterales bacterium]
MRVEWYGQAAFRLQTDGCCILIDPFGDVAGMPEALRLETPAFETEELPNGARPLAVVPAVP